MRQREQRTATDGDFELNAGVSPKAKLNFSSKRGGKFLRILALTNAFPYPPTSGFQMRTWEVLSALTSLGCEINLLSFSQPEEVNRLGSEVHQVCRTVELVRHSRRSLTSDHNYLGRLRSLPGSLPFAVTRFQSEDMRLRIARWIRSDRIDVILSETPYPLVNMPAEVSTPVIVNCQNVEHLILRRYIRSERSQLRRAYAWVECRKLERWEKQVCSGANLLFVCSEPDRAVMEKLCPGASVIMVPNTIDVEHYGPMVESDGTTLLYTGGMDWFPNRDAVEFFVAAILPELRRLNSRVKLVVAGRPGPDKFHQWLAKIPDVEFRGPVLDMRVEIARAAVCVVPLRVGSGTRLKILEAAAMAKPVVSTSVGAEGLDFTQGKDILIEDKPVEFAHVVAGLLRDPQRCRSLGEAARRSVEKHYGRPALGAALRVGLEKIVDVREDISEAARDRGPA